MSVALSVRATDRGKLNFDDNGATVYWRCDTGNDKQEKFRLRDSDLQGDYWRYYKTEDGVGTVTREHPYVDLTVRLYRNPNNNVARKAYKDQIEQCPGDAEVWVTIDSEPALKVGLLQQDTYDEDRTSWKFTPAASSVDAGMIVIVGHDKEGRVHLHYFPSTEMLRKNCQFTLEFKRTETFHDGGFIKETWLADWDHISFDIRRTYAIDYQQQLTPEVSFYKPGQMRFEVKGTLNECDGFEEKWKDAYSKIERTKMYEVTVTNRKTHASTGPITLTYGKEGNSGKNLDIDLPDYERATQGYDVSWTLTDKLQLTTKNEQQHVAGWSYEQDEIQTLRPAVSPGNLKAEFNQVQRSAKIDWNNTEVVGGAYNDGDHYYVYRRQALNAQGDASNTAKWNLVSSVKVQKGADKQYTVYDNARLDYRSYYTYRVLYVPAAWQRNGYEMPGSATATDETPTDAVQHFTMSSEPHVKFIDFTQEAERDNITLTWSYSQLPTSEEQVEFSVYRQHDGSEEGWQKMDAISVPAKAKVNNKPKFVDNSASACEVYHYKLVIELADSIFESEPLRATLLDKSCVTEVIAEKGAKEGSVLIRWSGHQVGNSETEYVVERRPLTSTDENAWVEINKQRGTDSNYSYTDERVEPGEYYTYRVSAYTPACGTDVINENLPRRVRRRMAAEREYAFSNSLTDLGFGFSRGVVSGRVVFGASTGVDSVRISLRANEEGLNNDFAEYSKYVTTASEGIYWSDTKKNINRLFDQDKPLTLQLWVMPTTADPASDNDTRIVHLASLPRLGSVDVALKPNLWSQVTIRINGDQARINVNGDIQDVIQQTLIPSTADTSRFAVGDGTFTGYLRDVRVWNRVIDDSEIVSNWGRILNGREPGLSLYWPLNEGIASYAFDISSASGLYNQRHGKCDAMVKESEVVPSDDLLALYGLTDVNGDYTIRGIPFVGEGTSYSLIPTKGMHKFDYAARNVNIGRDALALNNVNFVDLSSFTYSGTIRYLDTNIPVDSIRFAIDGIPVTKDGQDYCTGANGEFEFSVPIGDHYITATRNNHKTTRFPETGTYSFLQEGILNLYDSTLVNVAGRINGGPESNKEPIGFQRMLNRLGQAVITLALDTKTNNQFNMKKDPVLGFVHKRVRTVIDSQDKNIVSENYYPEDEKESTKICIVTNMENGEFSAMLPPLRYKVQSIKFVGNDPAGYNNEPFFSSDLPYIDARVPQMICGDTLRNESGELEEYKSQGRMVLGYRSEPVLTVNQLDTPNDAFGISEAVVQNPDDPEDYTNTVSVFKMNGDTFEGYRFSDYPLFQQDGKYSFTIDASEQYINSQSGNTESCPVSDGTVHISNSMSSNTIVCDGMTEVGHGYQPGDVIHTSTIDIPLSDQGRAAYVWCCGDPNLASDHTRSMKITLNSNNRAYDWPKGGEPFKGVILGDLLTGTGFVTKAPDKVFYTMRDPGGAASNLTLQEDTIKTFTETKSGGWAFTFPCATVTTKAGWQLKNQQGVVITDPITHSGTFVAEMTTSGATSKTTVKVAEVSTSYDGVDTYNCWKVGLNPSQKLSTGTGAKHIGRSGDSFFGASTNLYYGKGQRVYLKQTGDENFEVVMEEDIVGKRLIKTLFFFSEYYIVKQLIPEWEEIRNKLLISVTEIPTALPAGMPQDTTLYYTTLKPTDPKFGLEGTYETLKNPKAREEFDSINIINTYIDGWKKYLSKNEEAKYIAMKNKSDYFIQNLSIAGGSTYTYTHTTDTTTVNNDQTDWRLDGQVKIVKNALAGENGFIFTLFNQKFGYQWKTTDSNKETFRRTTSYTLADPNRDAALSIDVYDDPTGTGSPIFITQGGQTRAPWEGGSKVEYYDNEDHSSLGTELDKATMKIEKCDLRVEKDILVDLPAGDRAYIDLTVINESETGTTSNYSIQLDTGCDLYGASLTIDGKPVVNYTCTWLLPPGDHTKTLVLTPADPSVTEYRIKLRVTATDDDINIYSDWKEIVIKYQPSSAAVDLLLDHSVVNGKSQPEVTATISGLNRQFKGLKGVRLLYCREGSDQWITQKGWVMPGFKNEYGSYDVLNADGNITCAFSFAEDGTYRVKAQSFAQYGSGEVTRDSQERQVIQDRYAPSKLSSPSPSDGIITLANIDDVSVTLNEDIAQNMISKSQNVNILGYQNNISIEAGQAGIPQTALQLNGTQVKTPVPYDFRNRDFTYEFRYYRQSDGEIIGVGSKANGIRLGTQQGMLYVRIGEDTIPTSYMIPGNEWCHLALHYTPNGNGEGLLSVGMANNGSATQTLVMQEESVKSTQVHGLLTLGAEGTIGRVSRLSLWSDGRSVSKAYQEKDVMHSSSDKGIEGCWLLDEGHGTVLNDRARNNNMVVDENAWYLANKNLAVHLDGQKAPMKIPAATVPMQANDNYLLEFWFRAEKGEGSESDLNRYSTLVSTTSGMAIGYEGGNLTCITYENTEQPNAVVKAKQQLTANATIDNKWHHFALNVVRGISATFYLDGKLMCNLTDDKVPAIAGDTIYLGGQLKNVLLKEYDHLFRGDLDEFRLWHADHSMEVIDKARYVRLNTDPLQLAQSGMVIYCPMESTESDPATSMVETRLDLTNQVPGPDQSDEDPNSHLVQSESAPPLKVSQALLRLDEAQYDIVTDERHVYFKFRKDMYAKMNGNAYTFTLKSIPDLYGNVSDNIIWQGEFDLGALEWFDKEVLYYHHAGEETTGQLYLYNRTPFGQIVYLSGFPTWFEPDYEQVYVAGNSWSNIPITIKANAPVGSNSFTVYVTDENNIAIPLNILVDVLGDAPDWTVDASQYANVMNIVGQIKIDGRRSTNTQSMVAAFDNEGNCRGVAHPQFVASRNAYYVQLSVYGESNEVLTFRMYDADRNLLFTNISFQLDGKTKRSNMNFNPNGFYGSYAEPAFFLSSANVVQTLSLKAGWNWVSGFVKPNRADIPLVFADYIDCLDVIKGKTDFAMPETKDGVTNWTGSLKRFENGKMYNIKANQAQDVVLKGELADVNLQKVHLDKGWSWIGSTSHYTIDVNQAFAVNMHPCKDDLIKSQTEFAIYNDTCWVGTLTSIVPGKGYKYYSNDTQAKDFCFPDVSGYASAPVRGGAPRTVARSAGADVSLIDYGQYSDNMSIVLQLHKSGQPVCDATVSAYIGDVLRGQIGIIDDLYFLTVAGNAVEYGQPITLHIDWSEGELNFTLPDVTYQTDVIVGTPAEPYVIDLDLLPAAIDNIYDDQDAEPTYDLYGRRVRDDVQGSSFYIRKRNVCAPTVR